MTERIDAARHGTRSKYMRGCRCEPCKEAALQYQVAYRQKQYDLGYVYNRGRLRRPSKKVSGVSPAIRHKQKISKEIGNMGLTNGNP
jgi:hypothetical protein